MTYECWDSGEHPALLPNIRIIVNYPCCILFWPFNSWLELTSASQSDDEDKIERDAEEANRERARLEWEPAVKRLFILVSTGNM